MSRGGRGGGKRRGGDAGLTFSLESMGISRGEGLPPPTLQPPPLYPPIDLKIIPLGDSEVDNYLLTLKQELRQSLTTSKYYINPNKEKPKIEKYSDKYENIANKTALNGSDIELDRRLFPSELSQKKRKLSQKPKKLILKEIDKKLENLSANEKEDENDDENDEQKSGHELDDNATDEEKVEDLEDVEEGTDYTFSYFDNGENYLEESDDNQDEGPTY